MKLEKDLDKKIVKWLKENGWWQVKLESPTTRGVPDRICVKNGIVVFVEIKRLGKSARTYQRYVIKTLFKQGANVFLCDNFKFFKEVMNDYTKQV